MLVRRIFLPLIILFSAVATLAQGPGTAFTFQGKLGDSGSPVNGMFDMQFKLFDAASTQVGTTITLNNPPVQVTNGVFTVQLDFGASALPGDDRFLEIGIRRNTTDAYTLLSPRSKITSSPYAIRSLNATSADGLSTSCNACIQSSQIRSVDTSKLTGDLPPGSNNYIENIPAGAFPQIASFTILGDGTIFGNASAYVFDASLEFRIQGERVLSTGIGVNNLFAGFGAGATTTGGSNSFFGGQAGRLNTAGSGNSFFGAVAGNLNSTGNNNSFFGAAAGNNNDTGGDNSFVGASAGLRNIIGNRNTFVGSSADFSAANHSTGSNNTLVGASSQVISGVSNSTAIGANAQVTQSNSLVLGSIAGKNGATADTNVGIGTSAPSFKLHVVDPSNSGLRVQTNISGGTVASFGGNGAFEIDAPGIHGGRFVVTEAGNVGIGTASPADKLYVKGTLGVETLGGAGTQSLCRNTNHQISTCSSSIRYKTNLNRFISGLNLISNLRPVSFNWKQDGMPDFGLVAEDVAKVEPLLVTHNDKGEVEGVKYDRVGVVLINAVKEQQAEIETQQKQIAEQKQMISAQQKEILHLTLAVRRISHAKSRRMRH